MGCICSKGATSSPDDVSENRVRKAKKSSMCNSRREQRIPMEVDGSENDATTRLILSDERENKRETTGTSGNIGNRNEEQAQPRITRIGSINRGERGAQVLAGWPSWLTAVAGEAISGWIPRRADSFEKLEKVN